MGVVRCRVFQIITVIFVVVHLSATIAQDFVPSDELAFWFLLMYVVCPYAAVKLHKRQDKAARELFLIQRQLKLHGQELEQRLVDAQSAARFEAPTDDERAVVEDVLGSQHELHDIAIPFAELNMQARIGAGSFGEVIKADYNGTTVAVKRLLRNHIDETSIRMMRMEVTLLRGLRHPNVVQLVGASWDTVANICIVLEYVERGSLQTVLEDEKLPLSWADPMLKMIIDAVCGLAYLHSLTPSVLHRDMKPDNVLVTPTFGCKLTDFGAARESQDATMTKIGTPLYMAPEMIRNGFYSESADVFALGIMLVAMHVRGSPYPKASGNLVQHRVLHGMRPVVPLDMPPDLSALARACWAEDPADRPPTS